MKVRLDETLFKARAQENLSMTNDINKLEQVDALVECLDHFVADRKWVDEISRDELLTMVTQSNGDKEVLIESILAKFNTPCIDTKKLKECKERRQNNKITESMKNRKSLKEKKYDIYVNDKYVASSDRHKRAKDVEDKIRKDGKIKYAGEKALRTAGVELDELNVGANDKLKVKRARESKKLKEGYYGQTLQDFLDDCVDYSSIDKVYIYGNDDVVYEGPIDDIPEDMLETEFLECDMYTNRKSVVTVNVDSSEEYGAGTYEFLNEFLDDCNCELVVIYDLSEGEEIFSGYKDDIPEEYLEYAFASYDAPEEMSVNLNDYEGEDDFDESLKEDDDKEVEKLDTFDDQMDFLAKDEQEAIDGYKKVINKVSNAKVKAQLKKIETEEKAHKDYLNKVKKNKDLEYTEPLIERKGNKCCKGKCKKANESLEQYHYARVLKKLAGRTITEHDLDACAKEIGMNGYRLWNVLKALVDDMYIVNGEKHGEEYFKIPENAYDELPSELKENLKEADNLQTKATKMLSVKKYQIDLAWKNGKTWKTDPMTLDEISKSVGAKVTEKQFVDMMSDNIKSRKDAKNLTKAEIVKLYDYIDGKWKGKDVLWSIKGKTNENLKEELEAGDCVYHPGRDAYYYLKKHNDKSFELYEYRYGHLVEAHPFIIDIGSPFYKQLRLQTKRAMPNLKESWIQFTFEDGSNPYVAKTKEEQDRMFKKYKGRVEQVGDITYLVKNEKKKTNENLKEDKSVDDFLKPMLLSDTLERQPFISFAYEDQDGSTVVTTSWETTPRRAHNDYIKTRKFLGDKYNIDVLRQENRDGNKEFAYVMRITPKRAK